jgi:hypothetical protein
MMTDRIGLFVFSQVSSCPQVWPRVFRFGDERLAAKNAASHAHQKHIMSTARLLTENGLTVFAVAVVLTPKKSANPGIPSYPESRADVPNREF